MEARFRFKNLHYCGKPWEEIIGRKDLFLFNLIDYRGEIDVK